MKGDYVAAERDVNQSLGIFKQVFPEGHLTFAAPLTTLGLIQNKTGRSAQAESNIRKALVIDERIKPKGDLQIAVVKGALGECLVTQKRYAEAEPFLLESYEDLKKSQGEQNPRTIEVVRRLVSLYEAWNRPELVERFRAMLHRN